MASDTRDQLFSTSSVVMKIDLKGHLKKLSSGKVREIFEVDENTLLFVATDRISAYDVIMENVSFSPASQIYSLPYSPIPDQLNQSINKLVKRVFLKREHS
jgi:hypothetical protein